jgi:hypothetical protein
MLKKIFLTVFATLTIMVNVYTQPTQWEYFKYLPKESIIPVKCEQARNRFSSYFVKNRVVENCDYINALLKDIAHTNAGYHMAIKGFAFGLLSRPLKEKLNIILSNESERTRFQEFDNIAKAAELLSKKAEQK